MTNTSERNWRSLFHFTVLSAYFYAFMELLFFITKQSSLSILPLFEKVKVMFVTGGVIALLLIAALLILSLPTLLNPKWKVLSLIPSALILSITILILFDNFTYTVFKFGIISTGGIFRAIYGLGFLLIFWRMARFTGGTNLTKGKIAPFLTVSLLALSTIGILSTYLSSQPVLNDGVSSQKSDLPNILILGADGLSANYMSMYGYSQETTPFLKELAEKSLIAENAFPNASSTTASTTSALTGKAPITVGVFRYPDILSGNDSFEHLPGILKRQGYQTVEIGVPYYVDAEKLNLLDGFDIVNNHSLYSPALDDLRKILGHSPSMYFIQTVYERAGERLLHIFFIREMQNPLKEVNNPGSRINDDEKADKIIELLDQADQPIFLFSHFMDTHGPEFSSHNHVFYIGSSEDAEEWDIDLYKDALLGFDTNIQEIYEYLESSGKLDNTIIVVYTDHGYRYVVNQRIPVLIHFPENAHTSRRINNVEIIDIPVTLLDYLDIPQPQWMTGTSMLGNEPPVDREIISITAGSPRKIAPPFYQIKIVQVIVCNEWYALNVQENSWRSGKVSQHTSKCDADLLPTNDIVRQRILNYLEKYEYDIASLR